MKKFALAIILTIASCAAQKIKTINAADYTTGEDLYFQNWVGGAPGSGSGTTLYLPSSMLVGEEFVAIYFAGSMSKTYNYTADDRRQAVVRFTNGSNEHRDKNMNMDAKKEYGNQVPEITKLPVKLEANQALIAVKGTKKDELRYILLDNIPEKSMQAMPSMPQ
ncbi:MAG: hypothetical protein NWQ09_01135 [Nonlabens sp.]|nr:hypothetical protein [Nonlabens sp.]